MESRHDSENAERILYNMRPKELVSMLVIMPEHPASLIALTISWSHSMKTDSKP